jgi:hypothetical protein
MAAMFALAASMKSLAAVRNSGSLPMKPSICTISCPAMYASWASAQRRPSSRVIDWFCPSGSSVTRNVERFERETTSVCTLRLP